MRNRSSNMLHLLIHRRVSDVEVEDRRDRVRYWKCRRCTFENSSSSLCCDACYQDRVRVVPAAPSVSQLWEKKGVSPTWAPFCPWPLNKSFLGAYDMVRPNCGSQSVTRNKLTRSTPPSASTKCKDMSQWIILLNSCVRSKTCWEYDFDYVSFYELGNVSRLCHSFICYIMRHHQVKPPKIRNRKKRPN